MSRYMSETVSIWLEDLLKEEIKEAMGTIQNEEIWMKGSRNREERQEHKSNIENLEEYIDILKDLISDLL